MALQRRPLPVACTLGAGEFEDRVATWRRLSEGHLREREHVPGGVRLRYAAADGVEDTLRHLAALDSDCRAWAGWRVDRVGDRVVLEVTADGDGADVLRSMFAAG